MTRFLPTSKIVLLVLAMMVVFVIATTFDLRTSLNWIEGLGPYSVAAFIALYISATVLFIPSSILTLGAGFLFGVVRGFICVSIASTVGATMAFLIGRYLARQWISRKVSGNARFTAIDTTVAREGWKIVGLLRLSPLFPFNLLNYALGLTRVSLRHYFFASWIGMMPGTVIYVYLGSLAGDLATLGTAAHSRTPAEWTLYTVGLVATVAVTLYVTRIARQTLEKRVSSGGMR